MKRLVAIVAVVCVTYLLVKAPEILWFIGGLVLIFIMLVMIGGDGNAETSSKIKESVEKERSENDDKGASKTKHKKPQKAS